MGRLVVGLGPEVAMRIAGAMKQMEDDDEAADEDMHTPDAGDEEEFNRTMPDIETSDSPQSTLDSPHMVGRQSIDRDPELEQEAKLIQAYKTINELQMNAEKAAVDIHDLRQDKEELQQAFDAFKYEVENEGRNAAQTDTVQQMQNKADRDRDYIAELESELDTARTTLSNQDRQIERFKLDTDIKQKLRDDLQLLKSERDDLLQKSRANENLKKKIQTLQDQEKANATLREDIRLANEQIQELDRVRDHCAILQKANAESMKLIANGEQEIFDQKTNKKRLEHEYKVLTQKWEAAKERQSRDHETIAELENKLQSYEIGSGGTNGGSNGLGDELEKSERENAVKTR